VGVIPDEVIGAFPTVTCRAGDELLALTVERRDAGASGESVFECTRSETVDAGAPAVAVAATDAASTSSAPNATATNTPHPAGPDAAASGPAVAGTATQPTLAAADQRSAHTAPGAMDGEPEGANNTATASHQQPADNHSATSNTNHPTAAARVTHPTHQAPASRSSHPSSAHRGSSHSSHAHTSTRRRRRRHR
jgi:hypothetical protein